MSIQECMSVIPGESLIFPQSNFHAPSKKCIDFPEDTLGISIRVAGPFINDDCQLIIKKVKSEDSEEELEDIKEVTVFPNPITSEQDSKEHVFVINGVNLSGQQEITTTCEMPLDYISVFNDRIDLNHLPVSPKLFPISWDATIATEDENTGPESIHYLVQLRASNQNRRLLNVEPTTLQIETEIIIIEGVPETKSEQVTITSSDLQMLELLYWFPDILFGVDNTELVNYIKTTGKQYAISLKPNQGSKFQIAASPLIMEQSSVIQEFSDSCIADKDNGCKITLNDYFDYDLQITNIGNEISDYNIGIEFEMPEPIAIDDKDGSVVEPGSDNSWGHGKSTHVMWMHQTHHHYSHGCRRHYGYAIAGGIILFSLVSMFTMVVITLAKVFIRISEMLFCNGEEENEEIEEAYKFDISDTSYIRIEAETADETTRHVAI